MYDQGEYLYYSKVTNITIIKNTSDSISTIYIPFPTELLSYNEYTLDMMLEAWSNLEPKDKIGYQSLDTAAFLYNYASRYKNHKDQLLCYKLITCPFDKNNYDLLNYWYECYVRILNGKEPYLHDYYLETLYDYESEYKRVELYNYMMKCINIEPNTEEYMQKLSDKINQKIKEKNRFIYY